MADTSQQLGCAASWSFGDVLRILPSAARATLWRALKHFSCLESARSSCRALRELVDGQTSSVGITLRDLNPAELVAAFHEGAWLVRRPNCTKVSLSCEDPSALLVPFATAPAASYRAITELKVDFHGLGPLPGGTLLGLTSRLPGLTSLDISSPPPAPDCALERKLASYALSLLPNLANLTLNDSHYVPLIPDNLASQLTSLSVDALEDPSTRPTSAELATVLSKMTALRELDVGVSWQCPFGPEDVRQLLDAVPRTSLRTLALYPVGEDANDLRCTYAGGFLDTVEIKNEISADLLYTNLSSILGTAVRRSSAMGPRLRLLKIGLVEADGVPDPDSAAELYARCESTQLRDSMYGFADMETILSIVGRLGVPERLSAAAGRGGDLVVLRGPLVRSLIGVPRVLQGWLKEVGASAAAALGLPQGIHRYRVLPSAGTVLAQAVTPSGPGAVAEAARLLGGTSSDGGGGVAMVEAVPSGLLWHMAVLQVLQALWDGEVEGDSGAVGGRTMQKWRGTGQAVQAWIVVDGEAGAQGTAEEEVKEEADEEVDEAGLGGPISAPQPLPPPWTHAAGTEADAAGASGGEMGPGPQPHASSAPQPPAPTSALAWLCAVWALSPAGSEAFLESLGLITPLEAAEVAAAGDSRRLSAPSAANGPARSELASEASFGGWGSGGEAEDLGGEAEVGSPCTGTAVEEAD
ncbi:hypothetical protein HYH03_015865 [Edaphochlamys debaryana]|uniref:F-box domain-containing protein n=1 Tax=Edaphochlamys debaryana TaxID=47281 RepID=A0A835XSV2_9CHLO|nr:hypothetical protein HYH03_015865 [Edaphochlamys debaryana]|eukprot:KAG2485374.1 hypothetical protein HYH03_015865 [Edaphochlamys debaryana]